MLTIVIYYFSLNKNIFMISYYIFYLNVMYVYRLDIDFIINVNNKYF